MLVSEILRIKGNALFTTPPGGTVLDAVKVMAQHDIGSLVVMDHGQMAGMLTFAEVLEALAKRQGQLGNLKVSEIYVRDPLIASPGLDVMELRRVMLERHARYVPVQDGRDAARRGFVPRRRQGGLRRAELRKPHAAELHQELAGRIARRLAPTAALPNLVPTQQKNRRPPGERRRAPACAMRRCCELTICSLGRVRSIATHSRVPDGKCASIAPAAPRCGTGVSMKSCVAPLRASAASSARSASLARARPWPAGSREKRTPGRSCPTPSARAAPREGPTSGTTRDAGAMRRRDQRGAGVGNARAASVGEQAQVVAGERRREQRVDLVRRRVLVEFGAARATAAGAPARVP